jgi:thiol-disulfide isomerase/thioredoxin
MIEIKDINEYKSLIEGEKAVCALFTADWCPDCQAVKPVLPELEKEYKDLCDFISLDRDLFIDLCQEQNVFGIPSFIVYRKGKEIGRFVSKDAKTKEEIDSFLKKTINS